jgi:hypothetical protein
VSGFESEYLEPDAVNDPFRIWRLSSPSIGQYGIAVAIRSAHAVPATTIHDVVDMTAEKAVKSSVGHINQ